MESTFVDIDGNRTHYFVGGDGPTVVLLHSGEFGACAELSWEYAFGPLSQQYRVIAPDWLGFGQTAKVHDFENSHVRRLRHMARFLETLDVTAAPFVGNSMSATYLLRDAASDAPMFPATTIVAISGGGFVPANEAREALQGYDCSVEGMRRMLGALFHDPVWASDADYVRRRHEESLRPGSWECAAAARFVSPAVPARSDFGMEDTTPYEKIGVPVLLVTGDEDPLKLPHYGRELSPRIPACRLVEVPGAAHCSHIERADIVNAAILEHLATLR